MSIFEVIPKPDADDRQSGGDQQRFRVHIPEYGQKDRLIEGSGINRVQRGDHAAAGIKPKRDGAEHGRQRLYNIQPDQDKCGAALLRRQDAGDAQEYLKSLAQ